VTEYSRSVNCSADFAGAVKSIDLKLCKISVGGMHVALSIGCSMTSVFFGLTVNAEPGCSIQKVIEEVLGASSECTVIGV